MSIAIRTITRLQDADDAPPLGAGQNGHALTWNNATGAFVATPLVTDHGALTGLTDDDHSQYLLATGARTGASSQAQAFTNGITIGEIKPAADSTTALQMKNASGANTIFNVDTTNKRVGVNCTPGYGLEVQASNVRFGYNYTVPNHGAAVYVIGSLGNANANGLAVTAYSDNTVNGYAATYTVQHQKATTGTYRLFGQNVFLTFPGAGNVTFAGAYRAEINLSSGLSVDNIYGLYMEVSASGGTPTNLYGIYLPSMAAGTNNYAIVTNAGKVIFNNAADDADLLIKGDNDASLFFTDASTDRVGIGTVSPAARLHVDQSSTAGAVPVLTVDQADVSEEFIRFIGASTTDASQSLVDVADMATPGALKGWLKIYIQDDASSGAITDGVYFVPFYSAPSA